MPKVDEVLGRCQCTTKSSNFTEQCSNMVKGDPENPPFPLLCSQSHSKKHNKERCVQLFTENGSTIQELEDESSPPISPVHGSPVRVEFGAPIPVSGQKVLSSPPRSPAAAALATESLFSSGIGNSFTIRQDERKLEELPGDLVGITEGAANAITDSAESIIGTTENVVEGLAESVPNAIEVAADTAETVVGKTISLGESAVSIILSGIEEAAETVADAALGLLSSIHIEQYNGDILPFTSDDSCNDIQGERLRPNTYYVNTLSNKDPPFVYEVIGSSIGGSPLITMVPVTQGNPVYIVPCTENGILSELERGSDGVYHALKHTKETALNATSTLLEIVEPLIKVVEQPVVSAVEKVVETVESILPSTEDIKLRDGEIEAPNPNQSYYLVIELTDQSTLEPAKKDISLLMTYLYNGVKFSFLAKKDKEGRNLTSQKGVFWGTSKSIEGLSPQAGGTRFLLIGSFTSRKAFAIVDSLKARITHDEIFGRDMKKVSLRVI